MESNFVEKLLAEYAAPLVESVQKQESLIREHLENQTRILDRLVTLSSHQQSNSDIRCSIWRHLAQTIATAQSQRQLMSGIWAHRLLVESDAFLLELIQLTPDDLAQEAIIVGGLKLEKCELAKWFGGVLDTIKNVLSPKKPEQTITTSNLENEPKVNS